jgi:hypothetical protein
MSSHPITASPFSSASASCAPYLPARIIQMVMYAYPDRVPSWLRRLLPSAAGIRRVRCLFQPTAAIPSSSLVSGTEWPHDYSVEPADSVNIAL